MTTAADRPGLVERAIRRDRLIVVSALGVVIGLAWFWIFSGAGTGMNAWDMSRFALFPHVSGAAMFGGVVPDAGMSGMAPASGWTLRYFATVTLMWWVMMAAMMLPAAAPMVLLHARTLRHARRQGRVTTEPAPTIWFVLGYLAVWLGFSCLAAGLQYTLARAGLISAMMMWSESRWLSAGLLALAAAFQFSPLKRACLSACRSPVQFLSERWRAGRIGAARMGIAHGTFCLGCCWALMLLLFVGGAMNLVWIAALGGLALTERLAPRGHQTVWGSGIVLAVWAAATLLV